MTIVYGLKNCDTCRKAMKSLGEVDFVDVRNTGVPEEILNSAYEQFQDSLVNKRSTTWRNLGEDEREEAPISLLMRHPTLMKRPLIEQDGKFFLGWTKEIEAELT
ncbi:ArsC/Spx/MgsR family protein [Shimia marina]|uniref:Putative reductase n=1 Tax=Shimia marina TaxID=321267 RepID=A0A0P1ES43_9RHOB|nr:ArsC/Spx/MgsR family protein [Shimia marina]CUH53353.1 putative reductase [Shimia marina]SFD79030.1 arsenate reductase [Shimia marina]